MARSWMNTRLFSKEHLDGVTEFMNFVSDNLGDSQEILCPCRKCLNRLHKHKGEVEDHLYIYGMTNIYTRWIHHGEAEVGLNENSETGDIGCSVETGDIGCHVETEMNEPEDDPDDDRVHEIVQELYTAEDRGPATQSKFAAILEEMKQELHPDGPYTRFSFVVKLLHIKSFYRISNVGFTAFLKLLSLAFPKCSIPASYAEAKKVIRALGLGYVSIHVCPNNCVLFRKKLDKMDKCPVCGASRWKDEDTRKRIPNKVLRHFPMVPRLQRMFASKKLSEQAQWHKLKRKTVDNELSHPADGEAWKDFDRKYDWFAKDARNVRLGLATDGFNPFGKMSANYSMWPVFLIPYNFPPWECMEQSNFMMGLLIPGPTCPGKDMDLFLQPLIEELLDLWKGVPTYDALTRKSFDLHAAVIWCIHDYPALSTLSGRIARGYYACVRCDKNPCSRRLRNKICYIDHRRFLPSDHVWRTKKFFNGQTEEREQPEEFTMDELNEQLARVSHVKPGNHPDNKKRKRQEEGQCWKRRSILWDLPYWSNLKLRHNLDVMHIEKNICEAILGTFLDIAGKSKDTISARLDLEDMGIRKNLHLKHDGDSYTLPRAPYTMTKDQKLAFCAFIKNVKFPDGYASNLSRCISADECKVQGLKTHDCHILLQRILPAGLRGIVDKEIYEAIAELGNFFQQICAKTLKVDVLNRMRGEIPKILCKLEKIFPPSFFDVMVHLTIHLVDDAILRGPVQYGWMYPVERRLLTLKRYVRNMARPEGSIAEAYVANECLNACSRYFDDIDTRHNHEGRNRERVVLRDGGLPIFQHGVSLLGAPRMTFLEKDYDRMVWYVLNNTPEVEPFIEIFRTELLESAGNVDVDRALAKEFAGWFKKHLATRKFVHGEEVNDDLYALASQPNLRVHLFSGCLVNGVRYHTLDRERSRKTQNSGVMVEGSHNEEDIDFYGQLKEIIQLQYNSNLNNPRTIVLFQCNWFDTCSKKSRIKYDGHFKSISHGRCWYKDDAFICATQATKVFYLEDNKHGEPWKVVQNFLHRHLWNVTEEENDDLLGQAENELSYQDDEQENDLSVQVADLEIPSVNEQASNDEDGISVQASLVDQIRRERELEVEENGYEDDVDETLGQYDSENERPMTIPDDDGEYSDFE